jgi:UBX domain-containing protein 7
MSESNVTTNIIAAGASNTDELISQFMAFTGTSDTNQAISYLEMSGNDVETAVGLFLEHGAGNVSHISSTTNTSETATSSTSHHEMDSSGHARRNRRGTARGGSGGGGGSSSSSRGNSIGRNNRTLTNQRSSSHMTYDEDGIRAPDETRTMRLMDDDSHGLHHHRHIVGGTGSAASMLGMLMGQNPSYDLMTAMMEEQEQQQQMIHPSAFATTAAAMTSINARTLLDSAIARQGMGRDASRMEEKSEQNENYDDEYDYGDEDGEDDDDDDVDVDEEGGRNRNSRPEPPRLSDLFAPPNNLMHRAGGFQGARTMAKDTKRWLLVNLQRDSEFACHALNRDVWRDELVENLIREGFIFWQQVHTAIDC